jgi:hypothetical protein
VEEAAGSFGMEEFGMEEFKVEEFGVKEFEVEGSRWKSGALAPRKHFNLCGL